MARTAIPVEVFVRDAANADPATTAFDQTNGMILTPPTSDISRLEIEIASTYSGTKNVTFSAGVNPPAQREGIGALVTSFTDNLVKRFILESARFAQADGSIWVDADASFTGTIRAWTLPK